MNAGQTENQIIEGLMERGIQEEDAVRETLFVARTKSAAEEHAPEIARRKKAAGPKNMAIGGGIGLLGVIATVATEGAVLFYGAVISGAILFFIGVYQAATAGKEDPE